MAAKKTEVSTAPISEGDLSDGLRSLELYARTMHSVEYVAKNYFEIKQQISTLERRKSELEAEVAGHEKTMAQSKEMQHAAIARYERERQQKEADEKAKFEITKQEYYNQGQQLAEGIQDLKNQQAAAQEAFAKAQAYTEGQMAALEDGLAIRKSQVDEELAALSDKIGHRQQEFDAITVRLSELREKFFGQTTTELFSGEAKPE